MRGALGLLEGNEERGDHQGLSVEAELRLERKALGSRSVWMREC